MCKWVGLSLVSVQVSISSLCDTGIAFMTHLLLKLHCLILITKFLTEFQLPRWLLVFNTIKLFHSRELRIQVFIFQDLLPSLLRIKHTEKTLSLMIGKYWILIYIFLLSQIKLGGPVVCETKTRSTTQQQLSPFACILHEQNWNREREETLFLYKLINVFHN